VLTLHIEPLYNLAVTYAILNQNDKAQQKARKIQLQEYQASLKRWIHRHLTSLHDLGMKSMIFFKRLFMNND